MQKFTRTYANQISFVLALTILVSVVLGCGQPKSDAEWKSALAGKKLSMASNSGSFSYRYDIWFCGSGEYAARRQTSGFSTGGAGTLSMADEDAEQGRWRVEAGKLIVEPENGQRQQLELEQTAADVISLEGNKFLVESHNECR